MGFVAVQEYGSTALMVACRNGHRDIVKLLLAVPGVDVHVAEVSCVSRRRLHAEVLITAAFAASLRCGRTAGCEAG